MNNKVSLKTVLSGRGRTDGQRLALFAWLNLGIVESMSKGLLTAEDAVRIFFHAENALFVHRNLRVETAEEIMSRGVQLPDLFDVLPPKQARAEFQKELRKMRALSLGILERKQLAA